MDRIYYDLTELFLASGIKFKYYGIARTVMEVGFELAKGPADVRFVVFSSAHERFFEVTPRLGMASPTGVCDPDLPAAARPLRLRYSFAEPHRLRDALYPMARALVRRLSRRRWDNTVRPGHLRKVDLSGQVLVSLGRPKIMVDYLVSMQNQDVAMRFIPLLHDMIPLHEYAHPRQSMFSRNFAYDNSIVIAASEKLLTNSVFTKTEVEHFAKAGHLPPPPPIVPVLLPHELRAAEEAINIEIPDEPYLLSVGAMTGRKNLECVLQAMLHLHGTGRPVSLLVLAGALRKRTETHLEGAEFAAIKDRVMFIADPNQAELRLLYQKAHALVIASHMEGFGLPLGEALWLGTPVLSSTAPALREGGGDLAEYFDPNKPEELAALIDRLTSDPAAYQALKEKITAAKGDLRRWKDVAQEIVAAVG